MKCQYCGERVNVEYDGSEDVDEETIKQRFYCKSCDSYSKKVFKLASKEKDGEI